MLFIQNSFFDLRSQNFSVCMMFQMGHGGRFSCSTSRVASSVLFRTCRSIIPDEACHTASVMAHGRLFRCNIHSRATAVVNFKERRARGASGVPSPTVCQNWQEEGLSLNHPQVWILVSTSGYSCVVFLFIDIGKIIKRRRFVLVQNTFF